MCSVVLPTLVRVISCGGLMVPTSSVGNVRLLGERLTTVPAPLRVTCWGLDGSESDTLSRPCLFPLIVGVNLTSIWQLPPTGSVDGQFEFWLKSPVTEIEMLRSDALPWFDNVTSWAELVVPTTWVANVSDVGETTALGPRTVCISGGEVLAAKFVSPL